MALIIDSATGAGVAERLAWAGPGPDGRVIGDSGEPEREAPPPDAGEEVDLAVPGEVFRLDIGDAPFVDVAGSDEARGDQVAQPRGCEGVVLVVVGDHRTTPILEARASISTAQPGRSARTARRRRVKPPARCIVSATENATSLKERSQQI